MLLETIEQLATILAQNRAVPNGEVEDGGSFYELKHQIFRYPDGKLQTREFLHKRSKSASVVVPITTEGHVVMVVQPVGNAAEKSLIEFPAGYWDFDEDGITAGRRELAEETGYVADKIIATPSGTHYQDPGSIRNEVAVYIATGCQHKLEQQLDADEHIRYFEITIELAQRLYLAGYFKDANTKIGFTELTNLMLTNLLSTMADSRTSILLAALQKLT